MVSELTFSDLLQNPDVEAEKSIFLCSLKFPPMLFPSEEYLRDISPGECSAASIELLVPLMVLKIFWEQSLIQNKHRETRKDFIDQANYTPDILNNFLTPLTFSPIF